MELSYKSIGKIWKTTPNLETKKNTVLILWAKEEFKRDIRKYFEVNENENTKYQDLWDKTKVVFGEILWHQIIWRRK